MNGTVPARINRIVIRDFGRNGTQDLKLKFDDLEVAKTLEAGDNALTTISELTNGRVFTGFDTVFIHVEDNDDIKWCNNGSIISECDCC